MKIFQLSQRMFNTYGMEDLLLASFQRHHIKFLRNNGKIYQKKLNKGEIVEIGKMRIGNLLDKIVKEHGNPPTNNYPKLVSFCLVSPNSRTVGKKQWSAYFTRGEFSGTLFIVKVVENIQDLKFDDTFKSTLQHELQHLIANMYKPHGISGEYDVGTQEYYAAPHEAQAFCANIARYAFNSWKDTFEFSLGIFKWNPEKVLKQIQGLRKSNSLSSLVNVFLLPSLRDFDNDKNNIISSNPDLKKKYLYYSYKNFELLVTQYLNDLETKAKAEIGK